MQRTIDHLHHHTDEAGTEYACRLRVYEGHRKPTVVVAEPLPGSPQPVTPIAAVLAGMVFGELESPSEGMWWVELLVPGNVRCAGALPEGEEWSMAWMDHATVKGVIASPADHVLNSSPIDQRMVQLMILPNVLIAGERFE